VQASKAQAFESTWETVAWSDPLGFVGERFSITGVPNKKRTSKQILNFL
jgi:hypothetical protein